jgi:3-mercaptopyruvate sulfurtransferase SseA
MARRRAEIHRPDWGTCPAPSTWNTSSSFEAVGGTLKPADELTALLAAHGITPESAVATY